MPSDLERLLELERGFWRGDAAYYEAHLADDAIMVFGDPVGVLNRDAIIHSIREAPRWVRLSLADVRLQVLADGVLLLTYRATAARAGEDAEYVARASSIYLERNGTRELAFHQQTPGP